MKHIIIDGDMVTFLPPFGAAVVVPIPTTIAGTAEKTEVSGSAVCLEGDEGDVESAGCMYISGAYVIPGSGTLKISALAGDQLTSSTEIEGKKVILKGIMFDAKFCVDSPAMEPVGGTSDPCSEYSGGKGMFVNANMKVEAS